MEKTHEIIIAKDMQANGFFTNGISGNGFDGNGNNSFNIKMELTTEELKELVKDFI